MNKRCISNPVDTFIEHISAYLDAREGKKSVYYLHIEHQDGTERLTEASNNIERAIEEFNCIGELSTTKSVKLLQLLEVKKIMEFRPGQLSDDVLKVSTTSEPGDQELS